ncbi:unnamed protein product, partial [Symbiodinium natans]
DIQDLMVEPEVESFLPALQSWEDTTSTDAGSTSDQDLPTLLGGARLAAEDPVRGLELGKRMSPGFASINYASNTEYAAIEDQAFAPSFLAGPPLTWEEFDELFR